MNAKRKEFVIRSKPNLDSPKADYKKKLDLNREINLEYIKSLNSDHFKFLKLQSSKGNATDKFDFVNEGTVAGPVLTSRNWLFLIGSRPISTFGLISLLRLIIRNLLP